MKTVIEMARQVEAEGFAPVGIWPEVRRLCELVRADAIAEEREACAKVCDEADKDSDWPTAANCAAAIRARGNT
jgi:hypothetical protein